ncbi:TPM domain-containing protein [Rhodoferax sp.]|uniref:TPM domain-containing protein n=1 Tax=Rhodoferax sp. TaxID=50421 RepID=UPI001ED678F0|nr:TPM domain-containing protein [Rhodoferax sp.]MBT9508641.1 TPM domain-containing protein [Rhodoferax sp.]
MNIKRIVKHLLTTHGQVRRAFPESTLMMIEKAIKASETAHVGEIRFAVEDALDGVPLFKGQSARARAIEVFSQLRVWDTQHNNGLLIYVLLADRAVEIVADRGIDAKVSAQEWNKVCHQMEAAFKQANYEGGVVSGVQAVTQHLVAHFPADGRSRNELPDKPVLL